ncbi:hypothetical protein [Maritimibacter sp. HL-12]|jgi:hypothetical protein|uniref:hypothetical protein n=1 Tax=Maritimibacter sp. HL-12 TaxID=1162418 RepID=UPI000A0F16DB|nr:hypothetical protein [Maritimibacter sp. HL-12]SMH50485.1 hypothetical protein SAMN05661107_2320 [Maritimibacter sp. HL-12]
MAFITATNTHGDIRPSWVARRLAAVGAFFVNYMEMRSRHDRIEALLRLDDDELARRGLTRDGVVLHVFSDSVYL